MPPRAAGGFRDAKPPEWSFARSFGKSKTERQDESGNSTLGQRHHQWYHKFNRKTTHTTANKIASSKQQTANKLSIHNLINSIEEQQQTLYTQIKEQIL